MPESISPLSVHRLHTHLRWYGHLVVVICDETTLCMNNERTTSPSGVVLTLHEDRAWIQNILSQNSLVALPRASAWIESSQKLLCKLPIVKPYCFTSVTASSPGICRSGWMHLGTWMGLCVYHILLGYHLDSQHCKNIWVTSTMFCWSQLHACCVRDTLQTSKDASDIDWKCSWEASLFS